jgi:hypothetical protein
VKFWLKTAQFCATRCESDFVKTARVNNSPQLGENVRKTLFELQISSSNQLSYAALSHMKAGLASSPRIVPRITPHRE